MKRCTIEEHEMADQHELAEQELEIVVGGLTPQQWFADAITHVGDTVRGCPYWACGTQH
jgi:hypothetical protein